MLNTNVKMRLTAD